MRFKLFFVVNISHGYYMQECKDFRFNFLSDTVQLLKGGGLIANSRDGKLYVLADEAKAEFVSSAGKILRFGLNLLNPFFSNFTGFDFRSSFPLYRNSTNPVALNTIEGTTLVGQVFSHALTAELRPVTVTLKDESGQVLRSDDLTVANNRSIVSYDLTGQSSGIYHIEETYPSNTKTTTYYSDIELQRQGAFGVVEIKIDGSFYTKAPEFEIIFAPKQEKLKYYLVVNEYSDEQFNQIVGQLKVEDAGFTEDKRLAIRFDPPVVVSTISSAAAIPPNDPGAKVVLFQSQTAVTRQENARKSIQLKKNGEVLIPHLPQLGANKANADLIIQLSKAKS